MKKIIEKIIDYSLIWIIILFTIVNIKCANGSKKTSGNDKAKLSGNYENEKDNHLVTKLPKYQKNKTHKYENNQQKEIIPLNQDEVVLQKLKQSLNLNSEKSIQYFMLNCIKTNKYKQLNKNIAEQLYLYVALNYQKINPELWVYLGNKNIDQEIKLDALKYILKTEKISKVNKLFLVSLLNLKNEISKELESNKYTFNQILDIFCFLLSAGYPNATLEIFIDKHPEIINGSNDIHPLIIALEHKNNQISNKFIHIVKKMINHRQFDPINKNTGKINNYIMEVGSILLKNKNFDLFFNLLDSINQDLEIFLCSQTNTRKPIYITGFETGDLKTIHMIIDKSKKLDPKIYTYIINSEFIYRNKAKFRLIILATILNDKELFMKIIKDPNLYWGTENRIIKEDKTIININISPQIVLTLRALLKNNQQEFFKEFINQSLSKIDIVNTFRIFKYSTFQNLKDLSNNKNGCLEILEYIIDNIENLKIYLSKNEEGMVALKNLLDSLLIIKKNNAQEHQIEKYVSLIIKVINKIDPNEIKSYKYNINEEGSEALNLKNYIEKNIISSMDNQITTNQIKLILNLIETKENKANQESQ